MEALLSSDARRYAPSAARNRDPIQRVLSRHLPARGLVLEVASGSGEHIVHFAQSGGPGLEFQPSDPDPAARASIDDWVKATGLSTVRPALSLDAVSDTWPIERADMVIAINMVHISPWAATVGLVSGAARVLPPDGKLFLYGPYRRGGQHTAPSNEAFDLDLRARNPAWGVRDLEAVAELAETHGFGPPQVEPMPANNFVLVFASNRRLPW